LSHSPSWELEEIEDVSSTSDVPPGWHVRVAVSKSSKANEVIVHFDRQRLVPREEVSESSFKIHSHDSSLFYGRSYRFPSLPDRSVTLETRPDVTSEGEVHVEHSAEEPFCMDKGMAMVMFLRGFRSPLTSKEMLPCLSYYVSSWVFDDGGKFKGAMVYSFLLGLLTQGLTVMRVVVSVNVKKRKLKKCLYVVIYVMQVFMGYIVMLVPMTYSVELSLSVVAGLAFGYFLFHKGEPRSKQRSSTGLREPLLTGNGSPTA
jgi:Ctr copper transporter family